MQWSLCQYFAFLCISYDLVSTAWICKTPSHVPRRTPRNLVRSFTWEPLDLLVPVSRKVPFPKIHHWKYRWCWLYIVPIEKDVLFFSPAMEFRGVLLFVVPLFFFWEKNETKFAPPTENCKHGVFLDEFKLSNGLLGLRFPQFNHRKQS